MRGLRRKPREKTLSRGKSRLRRPWFKPVRERNPLAVTLAGLLLMSLAGLGAYRADSLPLVGAGTTYTAEFTESAGLNEGDEVRVAGVKVGEVGSVALDGARVRVAFTVEDAWVGDRSTVGIALKTLLGAKYLAVDPHGSAAQDPDRTIPAGRTTSPFDVVDAFEGLGETAGELDSAKLAESFEAISDTFENTPGDVRKAAKGLTDLSRTVSSRDAELSELLKGTHRIGRTLNSQSGNFEALLEDGNLLLAEVRKRRGAIHRLLTGTRDLGTELKGVVADNEAQLRPALRALNRVTGVLAKNRDQLDKTLAAAGPYYRLMGNALGNGRWMDAYVCGLVPDNYLPEDTPPDEGCMPPKSGSGGGR